MPRYQPNPKHDEPWQSTRRGSLCPKELSVEVAQQILDQSELVGNQRFAVYDGRAYCARSHEVDVWHGYPVGWREVPEWLRLRWRKERRVTRRDIDRNWTSDG